MNIWTTFFCVISLWKYTKWFPFTTFCRDKFENTTITGHFGFVLEEKLGQGNHIIIYHIKVSGIPSGNKLIKTIRYPHMWRYRWFNWHQVCLLKLYLNSLVHHRNIFGSSSKVFGNLRKSSDMFGNFRKFSEMFLNVRLTFGTILENLRKYSESGRKS